MLFAAAPGQVGRALRRARGTRERSCASAVRARSRPRRTLDGAGSHGARRRAGRRALRGRFAGRQGLPDPGREGRRSTTTRRRSTSGRSPSTVRRSTWGPGLPGEIHRVTRRRQGRARPRDDRRARAGALRRRAGPASGRARRARASCCGSTRPATSPPSTTRPSPRSPRSPPTGPAASGSRSPRPDTSAGASEPISVPTVLPAAQGAEDRLAGRRRGQAAGRGLGVACRRRAWRPSRGVVARRLLVGGRPVRGGGAAAHRLDELRRDRLRPRPRRGGRGRPRGDGPKGKLYAVDARRLVARRGPSTRSRSRSSPGDDVGTNGSSALYRPRTGARRRASTSPPVKDTGRTSRFGAFRWEGDAPAGRKVEFAFRSGESATPDTTWSAWSRVGGRRATSLDDRGAGRALPAVEDAHVRLGGDATPRVRRDGGGVPQSQRDAGGRDAASRSSRPRSCALGLRRLQRLRDVGAGREGDLHGPRGVAVRGLSRASSTARATGRCSGRRRDPDGDALVYEIEFRPARRREVDPAAQGRSARASTRSTRRRFRTASTSSA